MDKIINISAESVSSDPTMQTQKAIRNKGKSIISFPESFCVIDIETTGLDPQYDDIIEVSALKIQNNEIINKFTSLVKPPRYTVMDNDDSTIDFCIIENGQHVYYVDNFITKLTGITNKMIDEAPLLFDILPEFKQFIGDNILIGHNVSFDINFLYDNFQKINLLLKNDYVDTRRLSRHLLPELYNHKLRTLVKFFEIDNKTAHRSESDCIATWECYKKLNASLLEKFDTYESFFDTIKPAKKKSHSEIINEIKAETTDFDITHPLYEKECVFTGTLETCLRKDAMQAVVNMGGTCKVTVTKNTNFLILGNNDYCTTIKDGKSRKQKKAEELKLKEQDIEIISENIFYDLLNS